MPCPSLTRVLALILSLQLSFQALIAAPLMEEYDEAVSLGTACQAAWYLENYGFRQWAYPFDWMVTPFLGLLSFIKNKGADFLEKENLKVVQILPGNPSILHVVDTKYDIHSIHDFYFPDMANYDAVKAKYARRIKRFFSLLESKKKILFIRVQLNRAEAIELDALLHKLYPRLRYTLLALSDDPDAYNDWNLPRIKNFYMQQFPGDWVGDGERWREVLSLFSIKKAPADRPADQKW